MRETAKGLLEDNENLQKHCKELYTELQSAFQSKTDFENKLVEMENSYEAILSKNKELRDYIDRMSISDTVKNGGK